MLSIVVDKIESIQTERMILSGNTQPNYVSLLRFIYFINQYSKDNFSIQIIIARFFRKMFLFDLKQAFDILSSLCIHTFCHARTFEKTEKYFIHCRPSIIITVIKIRLSKFEIIIMFYIQGVS